MHPLDIAATGLCEENEVIVRAGGEEMLDEVSFLGLVLSLSGGHADNPFASAALGAVGAHGSTLDEALVGDGDDATLIGDEVLDGDLSLLGDEFGEARAGVLLFDRLEFVLDDGKNSVLTGENIEQVLDGLEEFLVLGVELVTLESGELVEPQFKDGIGLELAEAVLAFLVEAGLVAEQDPELLDLLFAEGQRQKACAGLVPVLGVADDLDEIIKVGQRNEVTLEFLGAPLGLTKKESCAAENNFTAVLDEAGDRLLKRKELRTSAVDGEHRDREGGLERRMLVEVVDDNLGDGVALKFNDHTGVLIGLVADGADVGDDLLVHQAGDPLHQGGPVDVVRDLGDDDLLASSLDLFHTGTTANLHGAAPCLKVLADTTDAAKLATGREVGSLDVLHQLVERDVGIVDLCADGVDGLSKIVRRDVGRHADRDACASVDQKIRNRCGENSRLLAGVVVVGDEIDRVVVHILHEDCSERTKARLGVTHRGRRITLHRAEVALSFDEGFAHGPLLSHVNECRVDGLVTVRVVVTHRLTDDLGALEVLAGRHNAEFAHRKQNASL